MTPAPSTPRSFAVEGMTCAHCERAVVAEVEALGEGVAARADAGAGRLEVRGAVEDARVHEAVAAAGYRVAP